MLDTAIEFDMTDELMTRVVHEDCIGSLRDSLKMRDLLVLLASCGIAVLAIAQGSHWLLWLAGLPGALALLLLLGWLGAYAWWPRIAIRRMAHLPHRHVKVALSESTIAFETASERLEVAWHEVTLVKRRKNFWLVCLRAGARIPVPRIALTAAAATYFDRRFP